MDSSAKVDITTMPSGHAKATVGDTVLAETDTWEEVEGNVYFPPGSVRTDFLSKTDHSTHCPWKGDASYYSIHVDGQKLENAAWYYPQTKDKAEHIRDHVAFCESGMFSTRAGWITAASGRPGRRGWRASPVRVMSGAQRALEAG